MGRSIFIVWRKITFFIKPSDSSSDLQKGRPWTEFHWTFANVWTLSALSGGVTATWICTFNRFEHVYFRACVPCNWKGIGVYKLEPGPDQALIPGLRRANFKLPHPCVTPTFIIRSFFLFVLLCLALFICKLFVLLVIYYNSIVD